MKANISARKVVASTALCAALALTGVAVAGADTSATAADQVEPATYEDVVTYCSACHFKNVENQSISSWNKDNCDAAMIESMMPMLDDETIQSLAAYFAAIEPAAE